MVRFRPKYLKDYFWQSKFRNILAWIIELALVVVLAFGCAYFFGQHVNVTDDAMEQTLSSGQTVFLNTAATTFGSPKRGDIIAYKTSSKEDAAIQIRRVIGLPGEKIQIKDGQIYIDGALYVEKRDFPTISNPGLAQSEIILGGTEYFVLGDSRNNSEDSRHPDVGNIDKDQILGVLWLRLDPFGLVK